MGCSDEASIDEGWALAPRSAGQSVRVCPPGFLATAAGTDSVAVGGDNALGVEVVEEVTGDL